MRTTIFLCLSLAAVPAYGQQTGTLKGHITTASGDVPVIGATVRILDTDLDVRSDAQGRYAILGVPLGVYTVEVSYEGLQTQTFEVEITAGRTRYLSADLYEPPPLTPLCYVRDILPTSVYTTAWVSNHPMDLDMGACGGHIAIHVLPTAR